MVKFFKQLDLIVDGSFKTEDIDFKGEKVPGILNTLAHNMSDSNSKLNVAIEDAVKKEVERVRQEKFDEIEEINKEYDHLSQMLA